jgi:preprotein translocase subunit YajC
MYGTITGVTDDSATIEVAEKVRVKVLKSAIADYAKGD